MRFAPRSLLALALLVAISFSALVPGFAQTRSSEMPPAIERNGVSFGLESTETPLSAIVC